MNHKMISETKYREFTCPADAEDWGNRYYGAWANYYKKKKLWLNHAAGQEIDDLIIEGYCGNDFHHVNHYLRYGEESKYNNFQYSRKLVQQLSKVISLAPRVSENIIVYKSVGNYTAEALSKFGEVLDKAFISTSLLKRVAADYKFYSNQPYIVKLHVKKGTTGIYTPCITNGGEYELLLLLNGIFKLINIPYQENQITIFECELSYVL